jgi:phage-related protein
MAKVPDKPLVWLHSEIKTPPFSKEGRHAAGLLLRKLQRGDAISMPHSRPMTSIGPHCHELRIADRDDNWRIVYRIDADAIVVADVFSKKSQKTNSAAIERCKFRLRNYDLASKQRFS